MGEMRDVKGDRNEEIRDGGDRRGGREEGGDVSL